jgi:hypothetical protein
VDYLTKIDAVMVVSAKVCLTAQFLAHAQDMVLGGTHIRGP